MKILWVKAGKLLPVDAGGRIRSFNILRQLQKQHEVTLLTYYGGERDTCGVRDQRQAVCGYRRGRWKVGRAQRWELCRLRG